MLIVHGATLPNCMPGTYRGARRAEAGAHPHIIPQLVAGDGLQLRGVGLQLGGGAGARCVAQPEWQGERREAIHEFSPWPQYSEQRTAPEPEPLVTTGPKPRVTTGLNASPPKLHVTTAGPHLRDGHAVWLEEALRAVQALGAQLVVAKRAQQLAGGRRWTFKES